LHELAQLSRVKAESIVPRVWWIGTGAASSCPFHTAGEHDLIQYDSREYCLARCISSYTPLIRSIRHSRVSAEKPSTAVRRDRSLLVNPAYNTRLGTFKGCWRWRQGHWRCSLEQLGSQAKRTFYCIASTRRDPELWNHSLCMSWIVRPSQPIGQPLATEERQRYW